MLGGKDLIAMGLNPGPMFRPVLEALLDARLSGKVETRDDEIRFVKGWLKDHPTGGAHPSTFKNKILDSKRSGR
jgi:hypothetical protein